VAADPVDAHLRTFPPPQRRALQSVREVLVKALPGAEEVIAWKMPSLRIDGDLVVSYEGFTKHNSLFPSSTNVFHVLAGELEKYPTSKGTIHFGVETPLPAPLLRKIVRVRIEEINASYPRSSGETKRFYANGYLKYRGRMKAGEMHGAWEWFRKDGSIMRTGNFRAGEQRGIWRTFTADGRMATEKSLS